MRPTSDFVIVQIMSAGSDPPLICADRSGPQALSMSSEGCCQPGNILLGHIGIPEDILIMAYLREYRVKAGLTLQQVADKLGLKPPAVNKWEKEVTSPTLRDLVRLAQIYGIAPEKFFRDPKAPSMIDPEGRIAVWARLAGVHPTAFFHINEDPERLDEAKEFSEIIIAFERISPALRKHMAISAGAYPSSGSGDE
jgi:transcriptional regulator with XRE-family HTH domain